MKGFWMAMGKSLNDEKFINGIEQAIKDPPDLNELHVYLNETHRIPISRMGVGEIMCIFTDNKTDSRPLCEGLTHIRQILTQLRTNEMKNLELYGNPGDHCLMTMGLAAIDSKFRAALKTFVDQYGSYITQMIRAKGFNQDIDTLKNEVRNVDAADTTRQKELIENLKRYFVDINQEIKDTIQANTGATPQNPLKSFNLSGRDWEDIIKVMENDTIQEYLIIIHDRIWTTPNSCAWSRTYDPKFKHKRLTDCYKPKSNA